MKLVIDKDLLIVTYLNGFKLIKPDKTADVKFLKQHLSVESAFKLPLTITIINTDSDIQYINEQSVGTYGFDSIQHALGKSIKHTAARENAQIILKNNNEVMRGNKRKLFEETILRKDELSHHILSMKSPLYNYDNQVIGLFGFGIVIGKNPLVDSLEIFKALGFLGSSKPLNVLLGKQIQDIYLSARECNILYYLIRGNTMRTIAKKLALSPRTIEHYIENLKFKLKVSSKEELIETFFDDIISWYH